MKICGVCGSGKDESEFPLNKKGKNGIDSTCKLCRNQKMKAWRERNADYVSQKRKEKYPVDREHRLAAEHKRYWGNIDESRRKGRESHMRRRDQIIAKNRVNCVVANPKWKAYVDSYRKRNAIRIRSRANEYWRRKYKLAHPSTRLQARIRDHIYRLLKFRGIKKSGPTFQMLGYSKQELVSHIERQFVRGMSWDNYGEWHCDHIVPLYNFDLTKTEQIVKAYALSNLRPLWAHENRVKNRKRLFLL